MDRYILGSVWDDTQLLGTNKNFEFLFETVKKMSELFDSQGRLKGGVFSPGAIGNTELGTASVSGDKIRNNSVDIRHLRFANNNNPNLWNGYYTDGWLGHIDTSGVVELSMRKNANTVGKTAVIPIDSGGQYTIQVGSSRDVVRVASTIMPPDFTIDSAHVNSEQNVHESLITNSSSGTHTVTVSSDANFLLVNVSHEGNTPSLIVVKGTSLNNVSDDPKIPKKYLELGQSLHTLSFEHGSIYTSGSIVKPGNGTRVVTKEKFSLSKGFIVGLHDYSDYFLIVSRWNKAGDYLGAFPNDLAPVEITDGHEFVISVGRRDHGVIDESEFPDIEKLTFAEFGNQGNETSINAAQEFYLTDDIDHDFEMLFAPSYGGDANNASVQYSTIISDYDTNILNSAANESYVTKHNYGTSTEGNTLHYYHYHPSMAEARSSSTTNEQTQAPKIPKIFIITGMHGNEKSPVFGTYALMNMITNNYSDNRLFEYFRQNIEIIHVPVANPDGFDRNIRQTSLSVDPNTDWATSRWFYQETGSDRNDPSGPWSQPEVVALRDLIMEHTDVSFIIDFHNMFFNDQHMAFATALDAHMQKLTVRGMMRGAREVQKKLTYVPQNPNHVFSFIKPSGRSVSTRWFHEQGLPAITLETIRSNEWQGGTTFHDFDASTIEIASTVLAEVLKSRIKILR